jgi:hypothetical protein
VISGEVGPHTLRDQLGRAAAARHLDLTRLPHLAWSTAVPALDRSGDVAAVAAHLSAGRVEVVVVDPLYLALSGASAQASNLMAIGSLLHAFATVCRAAGATVVLVHHTNKKASKKAAYAELGDLTQAGVGEFVRSWLLVHRAPADEGEDESETEDPGTYALTLNCGGSAGHSSRWRLDLDVRDGAWRTSVRAPGKRPAHSKPARQRTQSGHIDFGRRGS